MHTEPDAATKPEANGQVTMTRAELDALIAGERTKSSDDAAS